MQVTVTASRGSAALWRKALFGVVLGVAVLASFSLWADVDELWEELREVSPSADVVNEGRIVVAGSLADRGDLPGALRLLEKGWRTPKRPLAHHLRRAYALADLYERSGQTVRARELFGWVLHADPRFADVAERVQTLGQ